MPGIMQDIYDQGYEEAREEGRKEGIKIGRTEGRDELKNEIIVNMLKLDQPVDFIAKVVHMPVEKIIEIAKKKD